jgi:hypothetical protein
MEANVSTLKSSALSALEHRSLLASICGSTYTAMHQRKKTSAVTRASMKSATWSTQFYQKSNLLACANELCNHVKTEAVAVTAMQWPVQY